MQALTEESAKEASTLCRDRVSRRDNMSIEAALMCGKKLPQLFCAFQYLRVTPPLRQVPVRVDNFVFVRSFHTAAPSPVKSLICHSRFTSVSRTRQDRVSKCSH